MLFTSITFLYYFLPIVLIIYFISPKKVKNLVLLISSLLFYFYGEPKYIFLMLIEILIAYVGAILINKYKSKTIFIITLSIHVLLLVIFKYTDFIISSVNSIFNSNINLLHIALPIGISFYTFQIISYVIDVYKGKVNVQKNFIKLATYVSLFPQLIAGPIVRYETIEKELDNRTHSFDNFSYGVKRFTIGLAKKVLIANALGELCSKFNLIDERSVVFYWIFALSYMMQIYYDFSAYSDMAIGIGRIFGKLNQIRNIIVVWALTGIWHGASWNFVLWGLFFGIILIIEKFFLNKHLEKSPKILRHIYVLFIVMISFIIFNAENMSEAFNNITGLFAFNKLPLINDYTIYNLKSYMIILIISFICITPVIKNLYLKLSKNKYINKVLIVLEPIFIIIILLVVTSYLVDNSYNPFLYFRF